MNSNVQACERISRNSSTSEISNILAVGENVGFNDIKGIDFGIGYKLPEFDFGQFTARIDSTYFIEDTSQNLGFNNAAPFDYAFNNPVNNNVAVYGGRGGTTNRLKSNLAVDWVLGEWSVNWNSRFTSGFREGCTAAYLSLAPQLCSNPTNRSTLNSADPQNQVGGVTYHDVSVAYAAEWDATIRVGIKNVFEKDPPAQLTTFANSFDPAYEVPGSFYYLSYNQKF